jgi:signal peptidase
VSRSLQQAHTNPVASRSTAGARPLRTRHRFHESVQLVRTAAAWSCLGICVGLALAIFVPCVFGGGAFTVMSGSMEPLIHTGDVVVVERIAPPDARVGDVITFRDPGGSGRMVTHRIRKMAVRGGTVHFVTKGDAANGLQRWSVRADGKLGRVRYRIWKLGFLAVGMHGFVGRMLFLVLPALALGWLALARIWR